MATKTTTRAAARTASAASARLDVPKTYKLFIGGAFPRSESGHTTEVTDARGRSGASAQRRMMRRASQLPKAWISCTTTTTAMSADQVMTSLNWR